MLWILLHLVQLFGLFWKAILPAVCVQIFGISVYLMDEVPDFCVGWHKMLFRWSKSCACVFLILHCYWEARWKSHYVLILRPKVSRMKLVGKYPKLLDFSWVLYVTDTAVFKNPPFFCLVARFCFKIYKFIFILNRSQNSEMDNLPMQPWRQNSLYKNRILIEALASLFQPLFILPFCYWEQIPVSCFNNAYENMILHKPVGTLSYGSKFSVSFSCLYIEWL